MSEVLIYMYFFGFGLAAGIGTVFFLGMKLYQREKRKGVYRK